ncbi:hypothetical protein NU219Hw_g999t1 [Hortaea werneckii]
MDRLNSPAYGPAQQSTHSRATTEERQSFDSQRIRLRKKRSYNNAGVRNASQPLPATAWPQNTNARESGDNERARRGTLRNVVRRIFGRRSKEFDSQPPVRASPPRHGYHRSEPPALSIRKNANHHASEEVNSTIPHRTLSAPVHHLIPQPNLDRQRSPYAVEFPHSARLKPLNLANPFTAPGSQLRRRKTLPSLLIPDNEAPPQTANDARAASPDPHHPVSHPGTEHDPISPARRGSGPHGNPSQNSRRKSRSVGDLKLFQRTSAAAAASPAVEQTSPLRKKKNEDLRIWRDSIQVYNDDDRVLRASGFTSAMFPPPPPPPPPVEEEEGRRAAGEVHGVDGEEKWLPTPVAEPFPAARGSPGGNAMKIAGEGFTGGLPRGQANGTAGLGSQDEREGTTTQQQQEEEEEIAFDLEDRVARLEAGLRHFQLSLQRMTTTTTTTTNDRSRRSSSGPVVGDQMVRTTPSSRNRRRRRRDGGTMRGGDGVDFARTPSMLADTLAADFLSASLHHHHHHNQNGSPAGYDADDDPLLHRFPSSSSPLQYYYRQQSVHDPPRPESPQTPIRDSVASPHYRGNCWPSARPSMPPFPRRASAATTTTEEEDHREDEVEEEENFPFPAQSASFSLGARERTRDSPSGIVSPGFPVDSPSEPPPPSDGPWNRKRGKESAGFHFPFSSSFPQERDEEEGKERDEERRLRREQEQGQNQDQDWEVEQYPGSHQTPLSPPQQQQRQQQQQQQQHTFKSLYEMLSDERSARRNLEVQLRGLRREIRDLHLQVSSSSSSVVVDASAADVSSELRSRMLGHPSKAAIREGGEGIEGEEGSAGRFQDLFSSQQHHRPDFAANGPGSPGSGGGGGGSSARSRGAGNSGLHTAYPPQQPSSQHAAGSHGVGGMISRFSGSESEAGVGGGGAEMSGKGRYGEQGVKMDDEDEDELTTPLEAYQTPREEASRFRFRDGFGAF